MTEKTKAQTLASTTIWFGPNGPQRVSPRRSRATYAKYRKMRRDPTIALARAITAAPIVASGWSFEAEDWAPEGALEFIKSQFEPLHLHVMDVVTRGLFDFGWQGFEKVLEYTPDGLIGLKKLKPLLQDMTTIETDEETGAFMGYTQGDVYLSTDECLHFAHEVEGTDWYGTAIQESIRETQDKWQTIEDAAARYDRKIAGTHLLVHYPIGRTPEYNGRTDVDNSEIARDIINAWESSGTMAVPTKTLEWVENQDKEAVGAWKIELLTDSGAGKASFEARLKYFDSLKVRGVGLPERAVIEGQYGTKAEAEAHGDFAIVGLDLRHRAIVQVLNWHGVNQLLRFNWGQEFENSVKMIANPIADANIKFLRDVYKQLLSDPNAGALETAVIDRDSVRDAVGVPKLPMVLAADPMLDPMLEGDPSLQIFDDGTQPAVGPEYSDIDPGAAQAV